MHCFYSICCQGNVNFASTSETLHVVIISFLKLLLLGFFKFVTRLKDSIRLGPYPNINRGVMNAGSCGKECETNQI
jgi:hypothetical protein